VRSGGYGFPYPPLRTVSSAAHRSREPARGGRAGAGREQAGGGAGHRLRGASSSQDGAGAGRIAGSGGRTAGRGRRGGNRAAGERGHGSCWRAWTRSGRRAGTRSGRRAGTPSCRRAGTRSCRRAGTRAVQGQGHGAAEHGAGHFRRQQVHHLKWTDYSIIVGIKQSLHQMFISGLAWAASFSSN
jgi:hypothetical protein